MPRRRQKKRKNKTNDESKSKEINPFNTIDYVLWESMLLCGFIRRINGDFYESIIIPKDIENTIQLYGDIRLIKDNLYHSVSHILGNILTFGKTGNWNEWCYTLKLTNIYFNLPKIYKTIVMNYIKETLDNKFEFELSEFKIPLLRGNNDKSMINKPNIVWKKEYLMQKERIKNNEKNRRPPKYLNVYIAFNDYKEFIKDEYILNLFMMKSVFFRLNRLSFDGSNMDSLFISYLVKLFDRFNHKAMLSLKRIDLNDSEYITNKNAKKLILYVIKKDSNLFYNLEHISLANTKINDAFVSFYMDKCLEHKRYNRYNRNMNILQLNLSRNNINPNVFTKYGTVSTHKNDRNVYFYGQIYYEDYKSNNDTSMINKRLNRSKKRGRKNRGFKRNPIHAIIATENWDNDAYDPSYGYDSM